MKTALKVIGVAAVCGLAIVTPELLPLWIAVLAIIAG